MKTLVLLSLLFASTFAAEIYVRSPDYLTYFKQWKAFFSKEYKDLEEEEQRFTTWIENWKMIEQHNFEYSMGKQSYRLDVNSFSDVNSTTFTKQMNGYRNDMRANRKPGQQYLELLSITNKSIPSKVDWRDDGLVTGVKNQGQCGSCWAFSTTGSLEGQTKRKTGKLVSLSEQNLIDCSTPEGNEGCDGGLMDQAFEYIKDQGGIDTEESYPYQAEDESCRYKKSDRGGEDVGYVDIPEGDEEALKQAVATVGPISVAIDASHMSFQFYSTGVYDEPDCSTEALDHGVLVVGYGTEDGKDYWLVKNSWGGDWGEKGYIKMSRNKANQCGIATQASYPLV